MKITPSLGLLTTIVLGSAFVANAATPAAPSTAKPVVKTAVKAPAKTTVVVKKSAKKPAVKTVSHKSTKKAVKATKKS